MLKCSSLIDSWKNIQRKDQRQENFKVNNIKILSKYFYTRCSGGTITSARLFLTLISGATNQKWKITYVVPVTHSNFSDSRLLLHQSLEENKENGNIVREETERSVKTRMWAGRYKYADYWGFYCFFKLRSTQDNPPKLFHLVHGLKNLIQPSGSLGVYPKGAIYNWKYLQCHIIFKNACKFHILLSISMFPLM